MNENNHKGNLNNTNLHNSNKIEVHRKKIFYYYKKKLFLIKILLLLGARAAKMEEFSKSNVI